MNRPVTTAFVLCAAALATTPPLAHAQADTHAPAAFNMPDLVSARSVGAEIAYTNLALGDESVNIVNINLHGQYRIVDGLFVHGLIPLSYASADGENSDSALGNLMVEARYVVQNGRNRFGLSVGVGLPTASEGDFDEIANLVSIFAHYQMLGRYLEDTISLSGNVHFRRDEPRYFVQGLVGIQHFRNDEDNDDDAGGELMHLNVAAGYKANDKLAFIGELSTVSLHLIDDSEDQEQLFHWLRAGVRYNAGSTVLGGYMYLAIDNPDLLTELDVWGLGIDITAPF